MEQEKNSLQQKKRTPVVWCVVRDDDYEHDDDGYCEKKGEMDLLKTTTALNYTHSTVSLLFSNDMSFIFHFGALFGDRTLFPFACVAAAGVLCHGCCIVFLLLLYFLFLEYDAIPSAFIFCLHSCCCLIQKTQRNSMMVCLSNGCCVCVWYV